MSKLFLSLDDAVLVATREFDIDPQTWHQELHQYDADKFCPKCGCPMEIER